MISAAFGASIAGSCAPGQLVCLCVLDQMENCIGLLPRVSTAKSKHHRRTRGATSTATTPTTKPTSATSASMDQRNPFGQFLFFSLSRSILCSFLTFLVRMCISNKCVIRYVINDPYIGPFGTCFIVRLNVTSGEQSEFIIPLGGGACANGLTAGVLPLLCLFCKSCLRVSSLFRCISAFFLLKFLLFLRRCV